MFELTEFRWSILLALLILAMLVEPVLGPSRAAELLSFSIIALVLVSSLFSSFRGNVPRIAGLVLAIAWIAAAAFARNSETMHAIVAGFSAAILVGALIGTFRNLMVLNGSELVDLTCAVFGYTLLAVAWATLYVFFERMHPGSFDLAGDTLQWSTMVYFSLATLTTLGLGDVLPLSPLARVVTGIQAVVGVLYIAVLIGRIIGNPHRNS